MSLLAQKPSFRGGIHPPDSKLTRDSEIQDIAPPGSLIIPLSQHIGAPAEPVVEEGEKVKRGQKIGEAQGFVSSPIHASSSGEVAKIGKFRHPSGSEVKGVKIEPDGEDKSVDFEETDPGKLSTEEVLERIQGAGIVGMGGAAFPTHVKLSPPEEENIDTLVINGAECEPYLTSDFRLMLEEPEKLMKGTNLIADVLEVDQIYFGIEDNKPEAAEVIRDRANGPVEVVELATKYPQGWENTLIKALTGREVPVDGLPLDIGVVVQNVATVKAIWDGVKFGIPLTERVVTATGQIKNSGNYRVRIGTRWEDLIGQLGGLTEGRTAKLIDGGPMMGDTQPEQSTPVVKSTSGLLALEDKVAVKRDPSPCIRCGKCVDVCPANLLPTSIYKSVESGDIEKAEELNATACCECGSCTYVCPSEIPLVQWIVQGKGEIEKREGE
ncbi:electron transport complex subunit RsxC [Candidatus Bipolaricaulota bacterium]|nr:electron transport complex subunit RsxC [Candidatus Bipolaricaulota bacterium]